MNRNQLYAEAKRKAQELGYDLAPIRSLYRTSTSQVWKKQINKYNRNIKNRQNNYNRALRISREIREPLQLLPITRGTDNAQWVRELRRLRMRARRAPARIQAIQNQRQTILRDVQQRPQRQRARQFQQDIQQTRANKKAKIRQRRQLATAMIELNQNAEAKRTAKMFDGLITSNSFQRIVDIIINDNKTLTTPQANTLWNKIMAQGRHTMTLTKSNGQSRIVALNNTTKDWFIDLIIFGTEFQSVGNFGSDVFIDYQFEDITSLVITKWKKPVRIINNKDGKFFPYINTTEMNLLKYQIFNQDQAYDETITSKREHCLIHTLEQCGISSAVVNAIKIAYVKGCNISKKDLKNIATIIKRNIILNYMNSTENCDRTYKTRYKASETNGPDIEMCLYANHYFVFDKTKYSKYSITNYDKVKNKKNFHQIIKKRKNGYDRLKDKFKISSLLMVHKLFKAGYFMKLDMCKFEETGKHTNLKEHIYLDNMKNEQELFVKKPVFEGRIKNNKKELSETFYADCESYVKDIEKEHTLQLIGVVGSKNDMVDIMNVCDPAYKHDTVCKEQMVINKWLNIMTLNGKQNALCYFHNLKYDYHLFEKYINIKKRCQKDNQLYNVVITYKDKEIELRDSYKIIPFPLRMFQKEFGLPQEFAKKEAIVYTYYTEENNDKRCDIMEYCELLPTDEQLIFLKQIQNEPSYDKETNTFDPMQYYKEYLRLDCLVLKKGVEKFDMLIKEITQNKMSVFECLTISALTDKYMTKEGAYDDVYAIKGNLRAYVAKAVYGGRVCVNKKYQKKVICGKISDYDGVSLYPSAINRLCREKGLSRGKAKRFIKDNFHKWEEMHYAIITVQITKVNKKQQMPFLAHKNDTSILYTNEAPKEPIIIDSITLKDYIKFHEIEYEIMDGVYWNEGGNKTMGAVIQRLFQARLNAKKDKKKALSNTIKLMLNSAYGKTIMKKTTVEKKIIKSSKNVKIGDEWVKQDTKFQNYIYNNFNTIRGWRQLNGNNYEVEKICADNSYNRGHIGCMILSMSKRIMNELFDVANDLKKPIYYTDTDSLHCNFVDIPEIETEYEKRYDKVLTGTALEQFHTDFALDGACGEIYATKSIFLGKKSYIDVLESKDKNGDIITGHHIRLKGITEEGMEHTAKEYSEDKKTPEYFTLYEDLAKGTSKKIILNPFDPDKNHNKVLFEFKEGKVSTRKEFARIVKF